MSDGNTPEGNGERIRSIRGLDDELYRRFSDAARELNVTIGDLMNVAMGRLLVSLDAGTSAGERLSEAIRSLGAKAKDAQARAFKSAVEAVADFDLVADIGELTVRRADLEGARRPVVFSNIKRLVLADDVDWELVRSKVRSINVVDELVVPPGIPTLELAGRCRVVKRMVRSGGGTR
jgi:hypothetical protein